MRQRARERTAPRVNIGTENLLLPIMHFHSFRSKDVHLEPGLCRYFNNSRLLPEVSEPVSNVHNDCHCRLLSDVGFWHEVVRGRRLPICISEAVKILILWVSAEIPLVLERTAKVSK
jgi:hypothetical protein